MITIDGKQHKTTEAVRQEYEKLLKINNDLLQTTINQQNENFILIKKIEQLEATIGDYKEYNNCLAKENNEYKKESNAFKNALYHLLKVASASL